MCTLLEVEVEKVQLEVELVTPKWYDYGGLGCLCSSCEHVIFKEAEDVSWLKRVWCRLVELLGVVGCKEKEKKRDWWLMVKVASSSI